MREFLDKLDPDNDDHWTTGGEPKLEALAEFGLKIKREELRARAPGFTRDSLRKPEEEDLEAEVREAEAALISAQKRLAAANHKRDQEIMAKEKVDPHKVTRDIRHYLDSQQRLREERARRS